MARLAQIGFEEASAREVNGVVSDSAPYGPGGSFSTNQVHGGTYSFRANTSSSTGYLAVYMSSSVTVGFLRVYLFIASLPSGTSVRFVSSAGAKGKNGFYVSLTSSGKIQLWNSEDTLQVGSDSTTTLTTGQWYMIELGWDATTLSSTTAEVRIDGVQEISGTSNLVTSPGSEYWIGAFSVNTTTDIYLDDFALNDNTGSFQNSWPGGGKIINIRPDSAGDLAQWSRGGADSGSNYGQVDEVGPNDATDYNSSTTLDQEDLFNISTPTVVRSYYFDGHTAINDQPSEWTNDSNAADGSLSTYAYTTTESEGYSTSSFYLEGTNAPSSGPTITSVRARLYGGGGSTASIDGWGSWVTLTAPTGGWSWAIIRELRFYFVLGIDSYLVYGGVRYSTETLGTIESPAGTSGIEGRIYKVEVAVNSELSDSTETIDVVAVGVRSTASANGNNAGFKLQIKTGGTVEFGSEVTPVSTLWRTNGTLTTNALTLVTYDLPGGSTTAWTKSDLDSTQIGYKLTTDNTNSVWISSVWLTVEYTEYTDSTSTTFSTSFPELQGVKIIG